MRFLVIGKFIKSASFREGGFLKIDSTVSVLKYTYLCIKCEFKTYSLMYSVEIINSRVAPVEACWAHNPEVQGSKPCSAKLASFVLIMCF